MCVCNEGVWNWEKVKWKITLHKAAYVKGWKGGNVARGRDCLLVFKNVTHGDHSSSSMTFLFLHSDTLLVQRLSLLCKLCQKCVASVLYGSDTGWRGITMTSRVSETNKFKEPLWVLTHFLLLSLSSLIFPLAFSAFLPLAARKEVDSVSDSGYIEIHQHLALIQRMCSHRS